MFLCKIPTFLERIFNSKHFGLSSTFFFSELHINKVVSGHTARKKFIHTNWECVLWILGQIPWLQLGCWLASILADLGCERLASFFKDVGSTSHVASVSAAKFHIRALWGHGLPGGTLLSSRPVCWEKPSASCTHLGRSPATLKDLWHTGPSSAVSKAHSTLMNTYFVSGPRFKAPTVTPGPRFKAPMVTPGAMAQGKRQTQTGSFTNKWIQNISLILFQIIVPKG